MPLITQAIWSAVLKYHFHLVSLGGAEMPADIYTKISNLTVTTTFSYNLSVFLYKNNFEFGKQCVL